MFRTYLSSSSLFALPLLVGLVAFAAGCASSPPRGAAHSEADAHTNVVIVLGKGEVSRKPDVARTTMGISVTAPTVAEASRQANEQMTKLIEAIKKEGIADNDIQTANFSINFERTEPPMPVPMPMPAKPGGASAAAPAARAGFYRVSNTVRVTIRDLAKAGPLLDSAVTAGANEVWGISFEIDKPEAFEAEARDKASQDARVRAEALAKAQGRTLGEVVSVSENIGGGGPRPMFAAAKAADMGGFATPVVPGEITISAQLEVVYRLVKPGGN